MQRAVFVFLALAFLFAAPGAEPRPAPAPASDLPTLKRIIVEWRPFASALSLRPLR